MTRRVLISAYGCEPGKGSEQGVGWHWCMQLALSSEVFVITRANNRAAVETHLPDVLRNRIHFVFYDVTGPVARIKRKERGLYLYYLLWQWGAYRRALQLAREVQFDYVIHLTFGSVWLPTFMHRLPIPFIWGPIGGGEAVPSSLIRTLPFGARLVQLLRHALIATARFNPIVVNPTRRARAVLARTEDTARLFPEVHAEKIRVVLETGVSEDLVKRAASTRDALGETGGPLRVIYTGRLVGIKNIPAALHAVAKAKASGIPIHFCMVGDGPERASLEKLARNLGLSRDVTFRGNVSHSEVLVELGASDVYLFPSLKEGGVWSLLEAMSAGLPVVCLKTSGMSVITDDSSAIRIEPSSPEAVVESVCEALIDLARFPERRRDLGERARRRIEEHFRWENKGRFMRELFEELERSRA